MKSSISKSLLVILLISLPITNTFSAPKTLEEIAVEALRAEIAEYPRASEITIYQYGKIMLALSDLKSAFTLESTIHENTFDTLLLLFLKDESAAIRIKIGEVLAKFTEVTAARGMALERLGDLLEFIPPAQLEVQLKIAELLSKIGGIEAVTALSARAINLKKQPTSDLDERRFVQYLREAIGLSSDVKEVISVERKDALVELLDDPSLERELRLRIETVTGALFGYDVLSKKGINTLLPAIINLGSENRNIVKEASAAIADIYEDSKISIEEVSKAYDIYKSYMTRPAGDEPAFLLLFIPARTLFEGAIDKIENGTFWGNESGDYINVDDQIAGLRYVAKVKGEGAIEYLKGALGSPGSIDERVREAARESIGTIARDMLILVETAPSGHRWGRSWDRLEVLYKINNLKTYSPYIFYELSRFAFTTQFTDSAREARNYLRNSADYLEILIDSENLLHRAFALHALVSTDDLRELVISKTVELTRESESSDPETQRVARETLKQIHIILQKRLNTSFLDRNRIKAARLLAKIPKEAALKILMFSLVHQNADNESVGSAILASIEEILDKIEPVVKKEKLESLKSEARNSGLKKESRDLAQRILNYLSRAEGPLQSAVSQPALNLLRKATSVTTGTEETTKGSSSWRDFFKRLGEGKLGKGRPK